MPAQHPVVDVMLLLLRDRDVLLAERAGTGYRDGWLNLPSGKVEDGEDVFTAVIREAREEIGVEVAREDLFVVHATHHLNPEREPRVGWFLATERWTGEPANAEPHKCASVEWYRLDDLPEDAIVPYNLVGLRGYLAGQPFSVHGWDDALEPATHSA